MSAPIPAGPIRFPKEDDQYRFGLTVSIFGHIAIALFLIFGGGIFNGDLPPAEIYSVTLEGGKKLGGKTLVPDKDEDIKTPPKAVQDAQKKETEQSSKDDKKKEELDPKDAEISLNQKPTPEPTKKAKPTVTPGKTASPPKAATPKAKASPTPKKESKADIDEGYQSAVTKFLESVDAGGQDYGAARIGGEKGGGGVVRSPEFVRYMDALRRHVRSRFTWNDDKSALSATIVFEISPTGQISNTELYKSSGSREYDTASLRAIERSNPLPPPPPSVYNDFRVTRMTLVPREMMQ